MPDALPPELSRFVQQELANGKYQSEQEVVCEGLRLLCERERRLQGLRDDIKPALEQLDCGKGEPLDAESIKTRRRQRLEIQQPARTKGS